MRRFLIALCCLAPAAAIPTQDGSASSPEDLFPEGEMVYRPSCFGMEEEDGVIGSVSGIGGGGGGSHYGRGIAGSAPPKGARPKKSKPQPRPAPSPAPAPSMSAPMEEAEMAAPAADMAPAPPSPPIQEQKAEEPSVVEARPAPNPGQPSLDWGGTTWLSNDDSMSLASAQRLLWAVNAGRSYSVSQIRPHELLNYFSFDTPEASAKEVFDVQVSAIQEGETVSVAFAVKGAEPEPMPLDLTMIVDVSCSMRDEGRMDYTQRGLTRMADQLRRGDRLDLVIFDDQACAPLENYVVGRDDPNILQKVIRQMSPRGSTDMDRGLKKGYDIAKSKKDTHRRNRRVMVLTDAMLNTGDVNHNTVSEIGKSFESDGIRLTGVGVGRDFNDDILDKLTEKGKGAYVFLGSEAVVDRVFGVGFPSLVQTIAHDVRFELDLPDSLALERFYGEESSSNKEDIQPINYYAGTSQVFLQDLKTKRGKVVGSDKIKFTAHFRDASTGEPATREFFVKLSDVLDSDTHNIHKARALMAWADIMTEKAMTGRCGEESLSVYRQRAGELTDDAEIAYVNGLVEKDCGVNLGELVHIATTSKVDYKVKIDSDIPIAEVALECSSWSGAKSLTASDSVARFTAPAGSCTLSLQGNVKMTTQVDVPSTGGDVRCLIRGGRMSCS